MPRTRTPMTSLKSRNTTSVMKPNSMKKKKPSKKTIRGSLNTSRTSRNTRNTSRTSRNTRNTSRSSRNTSRTSRSSNKNNNSKSKYTWSIGTKIAPKGMPEYYIIKESVGDSWKADHVSGRYFDIVPKTIEATGTWEKR